MSEETTDDKVGTTRDGNFFENRPLYQSYYLGVRNIYAGEYPGDKNSEKAEHKLEQMIHFGVRHFIDLTEEGELTPYAHLLFLLT